MSPAARVEYPQTTQRLIRPWDVALATGVSNLLATQRICAVGRPIGRGARLATLSDRTMVALKNPIPGREHGLETRVIDHFGDAVACGSSESRCSAHIRSSSWRC